MAKCIIILIVLFFPMALGYTDDAINLLTRSSGVQSTVRRYCVELAKLPDGRVVNITGFGWLNPYLALTSVNACSIIDLQRSLPPSFRPNTLLILTLHQCKMAEQAWNVQRLFGKQISLMILANQTNTQSDLSLNGSAMPVSIPVLIFYQNDFNRMSKFYANNISNVEFSISYPLELQKKFRPAVLLMFALVFFILLAGNAWAADEFRRKISDQHSVTHSESSPLNESERSNHSHNAPASDGGDPANNPLANRDETSLRKNSSSTLPKNNEPAIVAMPYCIIVLILCFAVGWLLLIYYFPKVMIYILQGMSTILGVSFVSKERKITVLVAWSLTDRQCRMFLKFLD